MQDLFKLKDLSLAPCCKNIEDPLYRGILENLHLELEYKETLYLISPHNSVLIPNEIPPELALSLEQDQDVLDFVRMYLVENIMEYSFLGEANSYYLLQNDHTVIARLKIIEQKTMKYEISYYTNTPTELISHYADKIYIGRDFVSFLYKERRKCGLEDHVLSLMTENLNLKTIAMRKLHQHNVSIDSFLDDIEGIGAEFVEQGKKYLAELPDKFSIAGNENKSEIIDFIQHLRMLKHYLIEIDEGLHELGDFLWEHEEQDFVRYIIKFQTDVRNLIKLFNARWISRGVARLH